jgi:integrase/recombinase XerC
MPVTFASAIQPFLDFLKYQKRYSQHTLISYQNDLQGFKDFLEVQYGPTPVSEVKPIYIRTWLAG